MSKTMPIQVILSTHRSTPISSYPQINASALPRPIRIQRRIPLIWGIQVIRKLMKSRCRTMTPMRRASHSMMGRETRLMMYRSYRWALERSYQWVAERLSNMQPVLRATCLLKAPSHLPIKERAEIRLSPSRVWILVSFCHRIQSLLSAL